MSGSERQLNRSIKSEAVINIQKSVVDKTRADTSRSSGKKSQPDNEPPKSEAAAANFETKSAKSDHSNHVLMMQSERLHQQQMNHMRSVQEDQFRMLQLVLENNKKND